MSFPSRMTIARAIRLFQDPINTLSSQELCQHSHNLAIFGESSLRLNAYVKLLPIDEILEEARKSDERIQCGNPKSLLDGIPVTIKANIAVGKWWELPNACSAILSHRSSIVDGYTPEKGTFESDIARKLLKDVGAVLIGITTMDEFGMGSLGLYNGLRNVRINHRQESKEKIIQRYSPTYNPLPWMQRISSLLQLQENSEDLDIYHLNQIRKSTESNPHGIEDDDALQCLLEEVKYWTSGRNELSIPQNIKNNSSEMSPLLTPGGSSSGAAAAVAHGSCLLAIGTDTGGSLRLPAAWTSTVGFKPTYGTWSRYGVVSYASSLDTVGFLVGTTECAQISWRCLSSNYGRKTNGEWDSQLCRDSTARVYHESINLKRNENESGRSITSPDIDGHSSWKYMETISIIEQSLKGIRIGIPSAFSIQESPPQISKVWSEGAHFLQTTGGATLVSIPESTLPSLWVKLSCAAYYVIACAEASSNLSRYDGLRYGIDLESVEMMDRSVATEDDTFATLCDMSTLEQQIAATRAYGFGDEVQRRVLAGTSILSSDRFHTHYEAAAIVRAKLTQSLENVLSSTPFNGDERKVDVLLTPTTLSPPLSIQPHPVNDALEEIDSTSAFANDVMTIPISLGGFPSVSVPFKLHMTGIDESISNLDDKIHKINNDLVGLQIIGAKGAEDIVLKVASVLDSISAKQKPIHF